MKVEIKGVEYEIVEQGDGENVYLPTEKTSGKIGLCDYVNCKIYIHESLCKQHKKVTLIHELTHAYIHECCLWQKKYTDEDICDLMGTYAPEIVTLADKYFGR